MSGDTGCMAELTPRQIAFVDAYLTNGFNATEAAKSAGYSEKSAHSTGPRLLEDAGIRKAILEARKSAQEMAQVDAAWLLRRLADESMADVADLYDEHGAIKPVKDWPLIWRQGLVAGIDIEQLTVDGAAIGTIAKLRLSDRVKRLEMIGKHIGVQAFKDQLEVSGTVALADRMAAARKRVRGDDGE